MTERGWLPLIWTVADGYRLGAGTAGLEAYERAVVREMLIEIRHLITGNAAPHTA